MPTTEPAEQGTTSPTRTGWAAASRVARSTRSALAQLAGGLRTALPALGLVGWLLVVCALCLVGVGLLLAPPALRSVRRLADRERDRVSHQGERLPPLGAIPTPLRTAMADPGVRSDLRWVTVQATSGLLLGVLGVLLPVYAVRDTTYPLWWQLVPADVDTSPWWWTVRTWPDTWGVALLGLVWASSTVGATPWLARRQRAWERRLLAPPPGTDLSLRVTQLTATRAAALDAHVMELRRIERALHDGTQNRLVGVTVLLGAARRSLGRDPAAADEVLEQAQAAAEEALADLRSVARSIIPPVLVDRGLAGAVTGLAASCPVPCHVEVDVAARCPASVEATAYFLVAEALTNITRHSGASSVALTVRRDGSELAVSVVDDGHGGAALGGRSGGSGLTGVLHRVQALDGRLSLTSPAGGPTRLEVRLPCGS